MFHVSQSNDKPFNLPPVGQSYTWAEQSFDRSQHYYRIDQSQLLFVERLSQFAIAFFKTVLTFGLALAFASVRSQWREALWGKKEIIILRRIEDSPSPLRLSNEFPSAFCDDQNKSLSMPGLNFADKQRDQVPTNVANLPDPQPPSLDNNQLQTILDSIGSLADLKRLSLTSNQLQTILDSLEDLTTLQELLLGGNQLQTLPDNISGLANLRELNLDSNQLQALPDSLSGLTSLQKLSLYGNLLQAIPDNLGKLVNLQTLSLYGNQLRTITESLGSLTHLQVLKLENNKLQRLPDSLSSLANLQVLGLSGNQLQALPDGIGGLTRLQELEVIGNQLQAVPESIGGLAHLQRLSFENNQLQTIPESIGSLTSLTSLYLSRNRLQRLPECIGDLANLQVLRLVGNQLQTIPEYLYRLSQTCRVYLEGNPLSQAVIEQAYARINADDYQGPRFFFSVHERRRQPSRPHDLRSILPEWCEDPCKRSLLERLSLEQQNNLANWLARLKGTADYKTREQAVKDKIKYLLAWLAEETDADHVQTAHQILAEATSTCGDRVALSLNTLSLHMKICQSSNLGLSELKSLIIGAERYDRLQKIAEHKCGQLRAVDSIEVNLCYEIHLKDALGLPIETTNMLYERLAGVTQADIENARQQILAETGPERQIDILLEHPMWKKALESSPDFEQIKNSCDQQKEETLSLIDTTDELAAGRFYHEFQEKDKTVWNPCYLPTQQIARANPI